MEGLDFNELTRRPDAHRPDCWRIFCADICAGWIAKTTTVAAQVQWVWSAGFYPGTAPGEIRTGTAASYDEAKAAFTIAWLKFAHSRKSADFQAYRDQQEWTARKYALRGQGKEIPIR
jgi:hypothetical protein